MMKVTAPHLLPTLLLAVVLVAHGAAASAGSELDIQDGSLSEAPALEDATTDAPTTVHTADASTVVKFEDAETRVEAEVAPESATRPLPPSGGFNWKTTGKVLATAVSIGALALLTRKCVGGRLGGACVFKKAENIAEHTEEVKGLLAAARTSYEKYLSEKSKANTLEMLDDYALLEAKALAVPAIIDDRRWFDKREGRDALMAGHELASAFLASNQHMVKNLWGQLTEETLAELNSASIAANRVTSAIADDKGPDWISAGQAQGALTRLDAAIALCTEHATFKGKSYVDQHGATISTATAAARDQADATRALLDKIGAKARSTEELEGPLCSLEDWGGDDRDILPLPETATFQQESVDALKRLTAEFSDARSVFEADMNTPVTFLRTFARLDKFCSAALKVKNEHASEEAPNAMRLLEEEVADSRAVLEEALPLIQRIWEKVVTEHCEKLESAASWARNAIALVNDITEITETYPEEVSEALTRVTVFLENVRTVESISCPVFSETHQERLEKAIVNAKTEGVNLVALVVEKGFVINRETMHPAPFSRPWTSSTPPVPSPDPALLQLRYGKSETKPEELTTPREPGQSLRKTVGRVLFGVGAATSALLLAVCGVVQRRFSSRISANPKYMPNSSTGLQIFCDTLLRRMQLKERILQLAVHGVEDAIKYFEEALYIVEENSTNVTRAIFFHRYKGLETALKALDEKLALRAAADAEGSVLAAREQLRAGASLLAKNELLLESLWTETHTQFQGLLEDAHMRATDCLPAFKSEPLVLELEKECVVALIELKALIEQAQAAQKAMEVIDADAKSESLTSTIEVAQNVAATVEDLLDEDVAWKERHAESIEEANETFKGEAAQVPKTVRVLLTPQAAEEE